MSAILGIYSKVTDRSWRARELMLVLLPPIIVLGWVFVSIAISLGFAAAGKAYEYLTIATGALLGRLFNISLPTSGRPRGDGGKKQEKTNAK